jgi:hypothetical protein
MRLLLLVLLSPFILCSQTQIGNDIDGQLPSENSGYSVSSSTDGSIVAIGSPSYDGASKGLVRVFEKSSDTWAQIGEDITGEHVDDHFGRSLSLSSDGSILAIGGGGYPDLSGYVRVFENIGDTWIQIGNDIEGDSETPHIGFGESVNISNNGSILAISEDRGDVGGYEAGYGNPCYAYIYANISGIWTLIGDSIASEITFLNDITLSGDGYVVAISGQGDCYPGDLTCWGGFHGFVEVYRNISGVWSQVGSTFSGSFSVVDGTDQISWVSLNTDGSKIAIGGFNVRVYENITDEWMQLGEDINFDNYSNKISLSDNANLMAIGGTVTRVYKNNSGNWVQLGADIIGEAIDDNFGTSLELSGDGSTLVVGGPLNDGNGENAGHARVFDLTALLSVEESNILGVKLYPNPATNQFTIALPNSHTLEKVNIYNNLGQFIQTSNTHLIKTAHLTSGLYYVEVITTTGKVTKKLIIN